MNAIRSMRLFFLVVLTAIGLSRKSAMAVDGQDVDRQVLEGMKLSEEDAQQLEETLKHSPEDLAIRAKLLGYYSSPHLRSEWINGIRQREILWIIEHHPEARLAGLPYTWLDPILDSTTYQDGAKLWKQQVSNHTNEPPVLRNAANFFQIHDRPLTENLLKKGAALEPKNPEWPNALGHLYLLGASSKTPEEAKSAAVSALDQYKRAFVLTLAAYKRYLLKAWPKQPLRPTKPIRPGCTPNKSCKRPIYKRRTGTAVTRYFLATWFSVGWP
jgi:hypothetical protein